MSAAIAGFHVLRDNVGMARPMREGPPLMTRPPTPGLAPQVVSISGFGTGSGAGIGGNADNAWGHVRIFVGLGPSGTGTIVLTWPVTPAAGVTFLADWATLVVTGTNPYTVTWTAGAPLVSNSKAIILAYEWTTST